MHTRITLLLPLLLLGFLASPLLLLDAQQEKAAPFERPLPLRALLIAGGCCHDYEAQHRILYQGIQARANIRVDVVWTRDKSHDPDFQIFADEDWAEGYDLIIHDECAALKKDEGELARILKAHKTVPAVHLHCAMHSFRNSENNWHEHIGLASDRHGPHAPVSIEIVAPDHPITRPLKNWTIGKDELYNNTELYGAEPLALGTQKYMRDGKEITDAAIVAWTNTKFGAPSFSTSLGHFNEVVASDEYLDLITRGALWACGKLGEPFYQKPYTGSNLVREIRTEEPKDGSVFGDPPADATFVRLTAQSSQTGEQHYPWHAIDGDEKTRWCANGPDKPSWFQVEFEKPATLTGAEILWEQRNQWMRYTIETSRDGKTWDLSFDASENSQGGDRKDDFEAREIRFLKLTILEQEKGSWPSFWELKLHGPGLTKLFPRLDEEAARQATKTSGAGYEKSGNYPPHPHRLDPEEEAKILSNVSVPEGFDVSLFAPWQMANYPVYVAASPTGDLYVSSDGNGSLGRDPGRGRVLRLRDTDADGRADEVTEFVREIDAPRGLLWDHDRLYLLHPPHISVFHDHDGDGVADESRRLISDIAFGYDKRPADHSTNGLELGIDGWIYIAVGDFGFMKATGTDGRELQMRGGGVVRFRPDGSGLETFADGTRNILGTPLSPTLDMFARDNTNDGGGWDVRFHHFTGLDDHGYPRLYKNFDKEIVQPLADYGGGSGCGSVAIYEPGFPEAWAGAPFTCDWGRGGSFRHTVQPEGATFKEVAEPAKFIGMTRPTDADVDGRSAVYQASWKGPATFGWAGPDTGYIVRVTPSRYTPAPLPDFETMSDAELVAALDSPSHVRRLAIQRTLLRRPESEETNRALLAFAGDAAKGLESRIAALYALALRDGSLKAAPALAEDPALEPFVLRALGDLPASTEAETLLRSGTSSANPRTRLEAIVAIARLQLAGSANAVAANLTSDDLVLRHTAYRALAKMGAHETALAHVGADDIDTRKPAAWALMRMHKTEVIDAVLARLESETSIEKRRPLISILTRLYHREAEWKGDSWGTRPDTRGPYYQLETWEQSERILTALRARLADPDTPAEEAGFIATKLGKNRIQSDDALDSILTLAASDAKLIPTAIAQLVGREEIPEKALPLVIRGARDASTPPAALAGAVQILVGSDHQDALPAVLAALATLEKAEGFGKDQTAARDAFRKAPKLENHHGALEQLLAETPATPEGRWAALGVLELASRKSGSPESREQSLRAIEKGWSDPGQRLVLIQAATDSRIPLLNDRIRTALTDPDANIAKAAKAAANRLKIQPAGEDKTPKIATLKPEEALRQAVEYEGGEVALGEALFNRATCVACHTTSPDAAPKGPYLGTIAETYRRPELAEAILVPNKTIAQGFATNMFTLKGGKAQMGFVTDEAGETVTVRDITSAEHTFKKADIEKRETLPASLMPPGLLQGSTIHEFASLLDYLESLVKK